MGEMFKKLNTAIYDAKHSAIRSFSNLANNTPGCIALTLGEPDFDTPQKIKDEVMEAFLHHETHYISNNGTMALRQKIAEFENKRLGQSYSAENVIVTAGAEEGVFLSLFGILNPGDEVIVPMPAFMIYEEITGLCRGKFVPLDTEPTDFQIRKPDLEKLITDKTKAIVINSPNNPTGCVLDLESLQAVHDAALEHDLFIIADDVYQQLAYTDDCCSIAEYRDLQDRLFVVQSFSKPYAMTGWRMGYVLMVQTLRERFELLHQFMITSTPAPFQRAAEQALSTDPKQFLDVYRHRRVYMLKRLQEIGLPVTRPDGAFYVFPSIAEFGLTSSEFCTRMIKEVRLAATPGIAFGSDRHIRLTYCYSNDELREGLDRLEKFVMKLRQEAR